MVKKVLSISPFLPPNIGGVESLISRLNFLTDEKKFKIYQIGYYPLNTKIGYKRHEILNSYEYFRMPWFGKGLFNKLENKSFLLTFLYLFPGLFIFTVIILFKYIKIKEIKSIHAYGFISGLICILLNSFLRKKLIITTHSFYDLKKKKFLSHIFKFILKKFDLIIPNTKESLEEIEELGIERSKLILFKNWCDLSIYKKIEDNNNSMAYHKKFSFNLVFLGRLIDLKGIDIYLNLSKKFQNIGFFIIGSGKYEDEIKNMENKNIFFFSNIEESKIPQILNLCDLCISPVKYDESHSNSLMESISCGVPIVIPKRGAIANIYNEEVAFFCDKDFNNLEDILIFAKNNKSKLSKMSENCINFSRAEFSEKNSELFFNNY